MRSRIKILCFFSLACLLASTCPWAGWIENGIPLTSHTGYGGDLVLLADGSSGAFFAYEACRDGASYIMLQRVDAQGDVLWGEEGIVVCSEARGQYSPQITSDGSGGVIVTWSDFRSGNYDIYAQRVNPSGTVLWGTYGVSICVQAEWQEAPIITADGAGGAIVASEDERRGSSDIYVQRVNAE